MGSCDETKQLTPRRYVEVEVVEGQVLGSSHYIGLLLFPDKRVTVVDFGSADDQMTGNVNANVNELVALLRRPGSDPKPAAQRLYQKIFGPMEAHLAGISQLYLSLEGTLHWVPFAALHDGKRYLLDRYQLHYLTSGRDLLRESVSIPPGPPLFMADPDFMGSQPQAVPAAPPSTSQAASTRYSKLSELRRLPGTRTEAQAIAALFPDAQVAFGQEATEQVLRQARAPRIVHIATHGVFLGLRFAACFASTDRATRRC